MKAQMKKDIISSDVTLISKEDRGPIFLRVSKVGTKYVYGTVLFLEFDKLKPAYYETRFDMNKYHILKGLHPDMRKRYLTYQQQLSDWKKQQNQVRREFQYQASCWVSDRMDKWRAENLMPKPLRFDVGEKLI